MGVFVKFNFTFTPIFRDSIFILFATNIKVDTQTIYRGLQQPHPRLVASVAVALQVNQPTFIAKPKFTFYTLYMFYMAQIISPRRGAVGGDDALAALKRFGDDKAEVLGERRENEDVAPVPDLLKLITKGI